MRALSGWAGAVALALPLLATPILAGATGDLPPVEIGGAINSNVTQANIQTTICVANWTDAIRPSSYYTTKLKIRQLAEFGLPGKPSDYEEDHLISLELGGDPMSPLNLWPQHWSPPMGARQKDQLEDTLHRMVCAGQIPLDDARHAIASNWIAAYAKYVAANP
jgi:hypothetical protein